MDATTAARIQHRHCLHVLYAYTLSLRYRKRAWREWFYYEIAPGISFEDEFDYKANPGIRLRVEIFMELTKIRSFGNGNMKIPKTFAGKGKAHSR